MSNERLKYIEMINNTLPEDTPPLSGVKFDSGKPQWSLVPFAAFSEVVDVLTYGAKKYTTKGECNCYVSLAKEIAKYAAKDFVNLATTLRTNNLIPRHIMLDNLSIEKKTENLLILTNASGWITILTQRKNIDVKHLSATMEFQMISLICYLHNQLVLYVEKQMDCVSTTITSLEKLEIDFVKVVTLHLDSLKKLVGQAKHSTTCESMKEISGRDNWKKVPNARQRYIDAGFRHFAAYAGGEKKDAETGMSHLAHAMCCMLFLLAFDKDGTQ